MILGKMLRRQGADSKVAEMFYREVGSGSGGAFIRLRVLGPVRGNVERGGRETHRVSETNHGEEVATEGGQDVVYTSGRVSERSVGKSVSNKIYQTKTGCGGTVSGAAANI